MIGPGFEERSEGARTEAEGPLIFRVPKSEVDLGRIDRLPCTFIPSR